jgi:Putative F0F1-ATPase subunit Ca2+/Mg2+ transporter
MKSALAVGGTFAGSVLLGFGLGILVGQRTGQPLWAFGGLMLGLAAGGYSAVRLLMRSL